LSKDGNIKSKTSVSAFKLLPAKSTCKIVTVVLSKNRNISVQTCYCSIVQQPQYQRSNLLLYYCPRTAISAFKLVTVLLSKNRNISVQTSYCTIVQEPQYQRSNFLLYYCPRSAISARTAISAFKHIIVLLSKNRNFSVQTCYCTIVKEPQYQRSNLLLYYCQRTAISAFKLVIVLLSKNRNISVRASCCTIVQEPQYQRSNFLLYYYQNYTNKQNQL
jgi:hypothetical protein